MLRDLQKQFATAVTGTGDAGLDAHVRSPGGRVSTRIDVYRTTVQESLGDVLAAAYPVTQRIVGAGFFRGLAAAFIAQHPPTVPHLAVYGDGFADFVAIFAPANALPYLPDVARLEWARGEVYFAADAAPLDPVSLQAIAAQALPELKLRPHPAARLVISPFPALRIWEVNQPEVAEIPAIDMSMAQQVLITRPAFQIVMREISAADAAFVAALMNGAGLGDAATAALEVDSAFDLQAALQGHLLHGTFAAFV